MNRKEQIQNHAAYKYIFNLSPAQRYDALLGSQKATIEKGFNASVEEAAFTYTGNLKDEQIALSVKHPNGSMCLAVITPLTD